MNKINSVFVASCILSILVFSNCDVTEPVDIKPGRRDYTWTVDTLKPPDSHSGVPFFVSNIWGSSPNDVWAVCSGSSPLILLWHYDGNKWSLYPQQLGRDLWGIDGFTPNNVWIGDAENSIWHFNGSDWSKAKSLSLPNFDRIEVVTIWGISPTSIYAVGFADQYNGSEYKGILLHYNGKDWKFVNIPDIRTGFYRIVRKSSTGELIIYGFTSDFGFLEKLYVFDGKNIKEIYSEYNEPGLIEINGEVYVTLDRKIYKYNNGKIMFWKDFPGTSFWSLAGGRSEKDFFGLSVEGILHYNGTDLQPIYKTYPKKIELYNTFFFERDVFVYAYEPATQLNFIIRGTLNK